MRTLSIPFVPIGFFLSAAILVRYFSAHFFVASLDEGIYVNAGQRIAEGQLLYTDIFAFTGPITYWIQAALFSFFGNDLPSLRWSTALAVGAISTAVFAIGNSIANLRAGVLAAALWLSVWLDLSNRTEVNHRWISSGFYSLGCVLILARSNPTKYFDAMAGVMMGLAACTTPSFASSLAILCAYFLFLDRRRLIPFLLGITISCSVVICVLMAQGSLAAFIQGLRWAALNYAEANRFAYGRLPYEVSNRHLIQVYLGTICIPVSLAAALGVYLWSRDRKLLLPAFLCLALFPTVYPKWDAYSLHFIAGPFFALIFAISFRLIPEHMKHLGQGLSLSVCAFLLINAWSKSDQLTLIQSRAGTLWGEPQTALALEKLEGAIPAKSTVFVYPYFSGLLPLLDIRSEVHLQFMQPGMMTAADEQITLTDLKLKPPQFVFWQFFPDAAVKMIWPSSNPAKYRFVNLEAWIHDNYSPGLITSGSKLQGQVWIRKPL